MRRYLLIVMLVLLPLRGWSAQLMGLEMAGMSAVSSAFQHAMTAPAMTHNMAADMGADMGADCPMHASARASGEALGHAPQAGDTTDSTQQHPTCQACQLCMPLLGVTVSHTSVAQRYAMPLPQTQVRFVSAELAQAVKPPIC